MKNNSNLSGGSKVPAGFYFNKANWEIVTVSGKKGGVLPGDAKTELPEGPRRRDARRRPRSRRGLRGLPPRHRLRAPRLGRLQARPSVTPRRPRRRKPTSATATEAGTTSGAAGDRVAHHDGRSGRTRRARRPRAPR